MENEWHLLIQTVLDENCIALFNAKKCVASIVNQSDFQCDNTFVNDIHRCLLESQVSSKEIQSLTILQGPGYFTGIRAGMVIAKAWMDVYSTPVKLVNTFEYVHNGCTDSKNVAIVIRASKIDGYVGFFRNDDLIRYECLRLDTIPSNEPDWEWFTPSYALRSMTGIRFISPVIHLPEKYNEVTSSEQIVPVYGRTLEELFRIP